MSEDTGSCGGGGCEGDGSEGSTASVREDHSIITVAAEPDNRLTTVVISSGDDTTNSNGGIDNLAFQSDALHSLGENEALPAEAVNLELVNMTPFGEKEKLGNGNGTEIPVKNGKEADSAASDSSLPEVFNNDPYDEYFVPVNEHRKYIRGEKLYVTKDKRQQHKWRRTVCWGVALTLLAAAALIAVLAATGVILSQEDNPTALMNERLASSTTRPNKTEDSTRPSTTVTDVDIDQAFVPRALEGQLTINDKEFNEALSRPDSQEFKDLAKSLEDEIKMALFDQQTLKYGSADITVKVIDFMPGSVIVRYRIAWTPKPGIHNAPDPINKDGLRDKMSSVLGRNGGYLYVYSIPSSSLTSKHILDPCQANNGGCSHTCSFDYNDTLLATCSCPSLMRLAPDATTCIDALLEVEDPARPVTRGGSVEGARHFPDDLPQHHFIPISEEPDHVSSSPEPEPETDDEHSHSEKASPEPIGDHDKATPEPSTHEDSSPEPSGGDDHSHSHHETASPEPSGDHEKEASPEPSDSHNRHEEVSPEPSGHDDPEEVQPEPSGDKDHDHVHPEEVQPEPNADKDHDPEEVKPEPSGDKDHDHVHTDEASPEPNSDKNHSHDHPEDVSPEPEPSADSNHNTETHKSKYIEHLHAHDSEEKDESANAEPEPHGDNENVEPMSKEDSKETSESSMESSEDDKTKPEPTPADDDESHHYHIHHDHMKNKEHEHDKDGLPKAEPSPDSMDKQSEHHSEDGVISIPQSELEHVQKHPDLHMMQIVHMTEMPTTTVEPSSKLEKEQDSKLLGMDDKSGELSHISHDKETSTLESESVSEKSEPEPSSDSEEKKSSNIVSSEIHESSKPHDHEIVPDQEYSDHRESDDEDVIGIPLILELKPRPSVHDNTNHSSVDIKEVENETENSKDSREKPAEINNVSEISSHIDSTPQTPEEHKTEKSETVHNHESMAMMERNNEGNLLQTSEKERHIEIVHLMPLNMTNENHDISGELKQVPADNDNESVTEVLEMEDAIKEDMKPNSTSDVAISENSSYDHSTVTSTESNVNNDLNLDHETEKKNKHTDHSDGDKSNVVISAETDSKTDTKIHGQEGVIHENSTENSSDSNKESSSILFINEKEKNDETSTPDSVKPVHEEINEDLESPITVDSSIVENTPSPSSTTHVPSSEHAPTAEPDFDRPEDYDANNDLLGPLEENEEKKHVLKAPRFENSEKYSKNESRDTSAESISHSKPSHNEEVNDLFLKEKDESSNLNSNKELEQERTESSTQNLINKVQPEGGINVEPSTTTEGHNLGIFEIKHEEEKETKDKDSEKNKSDASSPSQVTEKVESHDETITKKPEKKFYKSKPLEKVHEESSDIKMKDDHMKMDRLGLALDFENEEETTFVPTTEMPRLLEEGGVGKIDVRLKLDDEIETQNTEKTVDTTTEEQITEKTKEVDGVSDLIVEKNMSEDIPNTTEVVNSEDVTKIPQNDAEKIESKINLGNETDLDELNNEEQSTLEIFTEKISENKDLSDKETILSTDAPVTESETSTEFSERIDATKQEDTENSLKNVNIIDKNVNDTDKADEKPENKTEESVTENNKEIETSTKSVDKELKSDIDENKKVVEIIAPQSTTVAAPTTRSPAPVREEPSPPLPVSTADPTTALGFSKCTAGQFQCVNGTSHMGQCVSLSAKCDSVNDCSDASDELGCIEDGCPGNFQCSNGQCLKRHLVCNGIIDCNDSSDEADCGNWQCKFDELRCPSGRCIPLLWQCDGKADCENHTDEQNCQASCGNDEYMCPERWCIPLSWRCNGKPDCTQGEDEKLCDCSVDQFRCSAGGCVAKSQVCDGEGQCPDLSDEWNCLRVNNETLQLQVRSTESEWLGVCSDNWDNSWSNAACQALGYSEAVFTEFPLIEEGSGDRLLRLKPSSGNASVAPLLGSLEKAPVQSCASGKAVEISCQDFNCGSQHGASVGLEARLVGGDRAADGQWPSVALVYNTKKGLGCTGSIVSPVWLLTSLSCLTNKDRSLTSSQWQVHAGGSVFIPGDEGRMQTREVRSIVAHPQARFNRFLYEEDVALVRLSKPLVLNGPVVGAICLTSRSIEPRQLCVTAGWGYTSRSARDGSLSQYLHYLPVPTIDLKECNSSRHYNGLVSKDHVCAGYTDAERSPCDNDEGAPLMCINEAEGVWELQGLLSYHSHCGRGFHPSIFTSVPALRPWVDSTLGSHFSATPAHNLRR